MIGFKNAWINLLCQILFVTIIVICMYLVKDKLIAFLILGASSVSGVSSLILAQINKTKTEREENTKKALETLDRDKASKIELKAVDDKINGHIVENRDTIGKILTNTENIQKEIRENNVKFYDKLIEIAQKE